MTSVVDHRPVTGSGSCQDRGGSPSEVAGPSWAWAALGTAAAEQPEPSVVLARAVAEVRALVGCPVGHAFTVDCHGELVSTAIWSHHPDRAAGLAGFQAATTRLRAADGLPGRVLATGAPVWIADLDRDPDFLRGWAAVAAGLRAAFAFPILVEGGVVAVLEFFADQPHRPEPAIRRALAEAGTRLGHAFGPRPTR